MEKYKNQKQEEIEVLEEFVKLGYVPGGGRTYLFCRLLSAHPYEFTQFMKRHSRLEKKGTMLHNAFESASKKVKENERILQKFLVLPPQSNEETEHFNKAVEMLEELLNKQTMNN